MGEGIATTGRSKRGHRHGERVVLNIFFGRTNKITLYFCRSIVPSHTRHTLTHTHIFLHQAGNKADLEARRKVDFNEANEYAEENGILHMETSAKNANNVKALFVEIAKSLPKATQQPDREAFPIMPQKQETRNCC